MSSQDGESASLYPSAKLFDSLFGDIKPSGTWISVRRGLGASWMSGTPSDGRDRVMSGEPTSASPPAGDELAAPPLEVNDASWVTPYPAIAADSGDATVSEAKINQEASLA
jgi:hypothetical protein